MHTDSSANRTCSESRSTSLCTATVPMPISLHVQMMRQAISPRLATRILRNRRSPLFIRVSGEQCAVSSISRNAWCYCSLLTAHGSLLFDSEKRLAVLHSLTVLDVDFCDFARGLSLNFIHQL